MDTPIVMTLISVNPVRSAAEAQDLSPMEKDPAQSLCASQDWGCL